MADRFSMQISYADVSVAAEMRGTITPDLVDDACKRIRAAFREAVQLAASAEDPDGGPGPLVSDTTHGQAALGFTAEVPGEYPADE